MHKAISAKLYNDILITCNVFYSEIIYKGKTVLAFKGNCISWWQVALKIVFHKGRLMSSGKFCTSQKLGEKL